MLDPARQVAVVVAAVIEQFGPTKRFFVAVHPRMQVIGQFTAGGQAPHCAAHRARAGAHRFDLIDARLAHGRLNRDQDTVGEQGDAVLSKRLDFVIGKMLAHLGCFMDMAYRILPVGA
ncbi:hypothetical protein WJ978_25110 [Achromobacter xylosoxidans]